MLKDADVEFTYREYRSDPLDEDELREVLALIGASPRDVLRTGDRAARENGVTGDESADRLLELMARHPTLLQRPIGRTSDAAVVGRPPERLLELVPGRGPSAEP